MDGLDNRKSNLRVATIAQNTRNVGPNKRNTTGYKGVYMYKEGNGNAGRYTATLRFNGKIIHGGYFNTIADAAEKYNQMSLKYHGEFGFINKITDEDLLKRQQYVKVKKYRQCKNKYTGLYGVSPFNIGIKNKFKSVIRVNSKHIHIGYFKTAEEAAIAYDNIALKLIGAGAKLNNP